MYYGPYSHFTIVLCSPHLQSDADAALQGWPLLTKQVNNVNRIIMHKLQSNQRAEA